MVISFGANYMNSRPIVSDFKNMSIRNTAFSIKDIASTSESASKILQRN